MTAQGKPDRCPVAVYECPWHGRGHDWKCDECHVVGHDSSPVPAAAPQAHIARCVCRGTPSVRHGICMRCRLPRRSTPHLPTQDLTTLAEKAAEKVSKFDMNFMEELANPDTSPSLDVDSDVSAPQAESVPSGKDDGYWRCLKQATDHYVRKTGKQYQFEGEASIQALMDDFAASQTAALADERDQWINTCKYWNESWKKAIEWRDLNAAHIEGLERSNSLLRERITAAEGLLRDFRDNYEFGDYVDSRIDDYFKENQ